MTPQEKTAQSLAKAVFTGDPEIVESFFESHPDADPNAAIPAAMGYWSPSESLTIVESLLHSYEMNQSSVIQHEIAGREPSEFLRAYAENAESILQVLAKHGADLQSARSKVKEESKKMMDENKKYWTEEAKKNYDQALMDDVESKLDQNFSQLLSQVQASSAKAQPQRPASAPRGAGPALGDTPDSCTLASFAPSLKEAYELAYNSHLAHNPTGQIRQHYIKTIDGNCTLEMNFKSRLPGGGKKGQTGQSLQITDVKLTSVSGLPEKNLGDAIIRELAGQPQSQQASPAK